MELELEIASTTTTNIVILGANQNHIVDEYVVSETHTQHRNSTAARVICEFHVSRIYYLRHHQRCLVIWILIYECALYSIGKLILLYVYSQGALTKYILIRRIYKNCHETNELYQKLIVRFT